MPRMQSPSSINTYKQCPRKYFYQYILNLPTKPSIYLIRGSIVHEVLEKFFDLDITSLDEKELEFGMRSFVTAHLLRLWTKNRTNLLILGLAEEELERYLLESQDMLQGFVTIFAKKLRKRAEICGTLKEAFSELTPSVEEEIINPDLKVKGFIDAIHTHDKETVIMDYKTSKKDELTPAYRLQLSIYALLYKLKYGKAPDKVGINFLKFGERMMDVDEKLLEETKKEVRLIHELTQTDKIKDFPTNVGPLCKWNGGQCDFYDTCIKQRDI
ncbi:PD-(D/E)XK nuclease family protein [Candidatus Woesearchaeota archaeon]|nr:PD-(D/E)XK nuclease family protein [Candidatus Woesearchaeota archaeon]